MKKNILIIYGSKSTEHDISILSALQFYSAIDKEKYSVILIYIDHNGTWFVGEKLANIKSYSKFNATKLKLKEVAILPSSDFLYLKKISGFKKYKKIDCAVLSLHGKNGEDGTIQGLLELAGIPYTSSSVLGSAVGLDKSAMKQIFAYNKVPITKYIEISKSEFLDKNFKVEKIAKKIKYPVVVKPNSLGSSIGISCVNSNEELLDAINLAFMFDQKVIIEAMVENLKEVNISVLGSGKNNLVSITEEVQNKNGLLSFEKKYLVQHNTKTAKNSKKEEKIVKINKKSTKRCKKANCKVNTETNIECKKAAIKKDISIEDQTPIKNGMQNLDRIMPANIAKEQIQEIETLAKKIFEITNSKGVVRIDFMIDQKLGKVYANEINTIPGSFAFYLWEKSGISFDKLADKLISIAISENEEKNKLLSIFNSSVLSQESFDIKK